MSSEYKPEFVACYKCKVKIPNNGRTVCDKCWDDNMKIAAAGWKDAETMQVYDARAGCYITVAKSDLCG